MTRPIFGSVKYAELEKQRKYLKKAKTEIDRKRIENQINFLEYQIKKEEEAVEEYFERQ